MTASSSKERGRGPAGNDNINQPEHAVKKATMGEEFPTNLGDEKNAGGKNATTSSSLASSSRVAASAASAPIRMGDMPNSKYLPSQRFRSSFNEMQQSSRNEFDGTRTPDVNSYNSSPLLWNSSTPQRIKSRREFEQKIQHRRRRDPTLPSFPRDLNVPDGDAENKRKADESKMDDTSHSLPNALQSLLLQTAMLGIDTTAKLSKPTLELTKNMLLPQLIIPLFQEVWEQYMPTRVRTWMKVVPTSLKNVGELLWDTEAGQSFGEKAGHLGENVIDMASSEVARQCWIDITCSLVKLLEGLHTPEVKALLDQYAVGMCRFVDVLSSGKAKQVWFDVSEVIWAMIEVGSDPVMVTSLADGCAHICFALERERESLKQRRSKASAPAGDSSAKLEKLMATKRRKDRDRRQAGTYPPGKQVVMEGAGQEGFEEALLDGSNGYEQDREEFEEQIYVRIDNNTENDGPPQRVIVPTNSSENIGEDQPRNDGDGNVGVGGGAIDPNAETQDAASDITTEIEDLGRGRDQINDDDVQTQSSASEKRPSTQQNNDIAYEKDGNVDYSEPLQNQVDQLDWRPNDDGTASEMYDAFDEPVLQFYRRLNEVLVETRKKSKLDLHYSSTRGDQHSRGEINEDNPATADSSAVEKDVPTTAALASKGLFGVRKKYWKLLILAVILGVATTCILWLALGCYGFYVIFLGGGRGFSSPLLPPLAGRQQQPNIVIQLVTTNSQADECTSANGETCLNKNDGVASIITLDDWRKLKLDVDTIISQTSEKRADPDG